MNLQKRVVEDWKAAMKNKDARKDALSMIIAELKNRAIKDNIMGGDGRSVSDDTAFEVLQKMAKQRREAMESYRAAGRQDLAEKEERELFVVEAYLPKSLTDDELESLVKEAIAESNASSMKDIGKVMGVAISKAAGRADGKRIQAVVKSLL
ncbi:MAG: GatB/YqeY domain-containing protein [Myxococcales bacterium]|nr:GatB/YqeY domain-containing protein [Myxococcales bacterium]USN50980.1 MAG: GatB/YqeY domain-containing protein [Myxococcales bacterium]